jgi:carbon-monoxide dehydrogenase iron sulfur subunit
MTCPYGMINREEERRIAVKCDRCPEREEPACVNACPTKALVFAEEQEFTKLVRRETLSKLLPGYAS